MAVEVKVLTLMILGVDFLNGFHVFFIKEERW